MAIEQQPILSIAVPTFNMEKWLEKNLATYYDAALIGRLEVLMLNNASEDRSKEIMVGFEAKCPQIFKLVDRDSRGYGSSINDAMQRAQGKYFRIVDADDWVDTAQLVKLVDALERCEADVVLTDYQIVNMQDGSTTPVRAADKGVEYGTVFTGWEECIRLLPSIHSTTYKTELLRKSGFYMQDKMFFVDEEYVVLPYLYAKTAICYPFDIYRYQVANPAQSTSPKNRAKYFEHREKVLKRLIEAYNAAQQAGDNAALPYCFERIRRGVGDHFTTLYMYVEDRRQGRELAAQWRAYVQQNAPAFWQTARKKARILNAMNLLHISLKQYEAMKKALRK
jgi:glycosyltransferase involved in cell wall biosynthesis